MDYSFNFDFNFPSFFYDYETEQNASFLLSQVSNWFEDVFDLFIAFMSRTGFLWIWIAALFCLVVARLIIFPIIGGKSFDLGSDRSGRSGKDK